MALLISKNDGTIDVISSKDSAVKCDDEAYKLYLESLDEDLLELDGEPTRFVMKKGLNYKEQMIIKDAQVKQEGRTHKIALSYMIEEVRISLVDIKNPADIDITNSIVYKRESDGKCSKEVIAILETAGIATELFSARQNAIAELGIDTKKK